MVEELDQLGLLVTPDRPQPRPLEYADLARLTYLNCVIRVGSSPRPDSDPLRSSILGAT